MLVRQQTESLPLAVFQGGRVVVMPGIESRMNVIDGKSMDLAAPVESELDVWVHYISAYKDGLIPEAPYELYDARTRIAMPIRLAGRWIAANPGDTSRHPADENLVILLHITVQFCRCAVEICGSLEVGEISVDPEVEHSTIAAYLYFSVEQGDQVGFGASG